MPNRKHEVVVITGAGAGVGRATAREFARHGASIGLLARDAERLEAARLEVEALGGRAIAVPCDVADAEAVERAAAQVESAFGPIDVWINNAMTSVFSPVREMTPDEFRRVTDVTYHGYVWGTLTALRRMLPRDRGVIVQVGSALAYRSIPLQSAYCAAKAAIRAFTDSLRTELMHDGARVRLSMVQLPAHNTPQFRWVKSRMPNRAQPVPPIFQPEVAAKAIYFAAHSERREVWVGWSTVQAILSAKIAPAIGDWYLARIGYRAQQTNEPAPPNQPHNLWEPVRGPHGAHGDFDERARGFSLNWWLNRHRRIFAAAAFGAAAIGGLLGWTRSRPPTPARLERRLRRIRRQVERTAERAA